MNLAGKRLRPVRRNMATEDFADLELPYYFGGRGRDIAYDLEEVDTGKIVHRGQTEREEYAEGFFHEMWKRPHDPNGTQDCRCLAR